MKQKQFQRRTLQVIPAVQQVINNNYNTDVKKLATIFSIGRNAIQSAIKEECGVGVRAYRLSKRMEQAKKMIEEGKEIKEIAITLKYSGFRPFSRAFKNYYGVLPTEWHEECKLLPLSAKCNLKYLETGISPSYLADREHKQPH